MAFLVQIRQSNKCGSVRNDEIINLNLRCDVSQHPLLLARHQPHLLIPCAETINQEKKKESRDEIKIPKNCFVLPWPTYTEPRTKRGRLGTQL